MSRKINSSKLTPKVDKEWNKVKFGAILQASHNRARLANFELHALLPKAPKQPYSTPTFFINFYRLLALNQVVRTSFHPFLAI